MVYSGGLHNLTEQNDEKVSLTRKCCNHTLPNNPRQREEESHSTNSQMTLKRNKVKTTSSLVPSDMIAKTRNDTNLLPTKQ